jgi:hypothetical protein
VIFVKEFVDFGDYKHMNKYTIIFVISVLLLLFGLCGCIKEEIVDDNGKVELVSYDIKTRWSIDFGNKTEDYESAGFNHSIPENSINVKYEINGTVRNIAGEGLEKIKIIVKFYDENGSLLYDKYNYILYLPDTYTEDFIINSTQIDSKAFKNVDSIKFEFDA